MNQSYLVPQPELGEQWQQQEPYVGLLAQAAQRGADQELEACCEWVEREIGHGRQWNAELRAARRPRPPSLKEQALEALDRMDQLPTTEDKSTIRFALEQLSDAL